MGKVLSLPALCLLLPLCDTWYNHLVLSFEKGFTRTSASNFCVLFFEGNNSSKISKNLKCEAYEAQKPISKMNEGRCSGEAKIQKVKKRQNDVIARYPSIFVRDLLIEFKGQKLQLSGAHVIKLILF